MVNPKLKSFETTMSLKGQIVILKEIRRRLNLKPNQKFREYIKNDKIILEPVIPLTELGGSLKNMGNGKTKKQIIQEIKSGWK
ncbi:MAG: AbrB/MazE/SpoVT family DNA-binding domain-containing protein [Thermoplasmata archaeon]|nr:AbrB/MazE/SpoVT family DNA-binding domain-containing protein [Thermoplasmata archaeon]